MSSPHPLQALNISRSIAAMLCASAIILVLVPREVNAQSGIGPSVEWRDIMVPTFTSPWGKHYTWDQGLMDYVPTQITSSTPITPATSGEDWWYAHCNLYDGTDHIGYAALGYNTIPNWGYVDQTGCFAWIWSNDPLDPDDDPKPQEFETWEHRKGALRQWIARYDLDGNMVWCRSYLPGVLYGVAQAADGSIVAVGEAHTNRRSEDPANLGSQWPISYNPGLTTSGDISGLDCASAGLGQLALKSTVLKVDLSGQVVWQHFYGIPQANADGWNHRSNGWAIEAAQVNGGPGFVVLASGRTGSGGPTGEHPYLMRIDEDGQIVDRHVFYAGDPALSAIGVGVVEQIRPLGMDLRNVSGQQRLVVSGQLAQSGANNRAFLWYMDDADNAPYSVTMAQVTNSPQLLTHHNASLQQHTTGVVLADEAGAPVVIWPILSDYIIGDIFAGRSVATLKVHRLDPPSNAITWTSNLGEVRAYDLQADGVFTSDGEVAVVSSKWSPPYTIGNPFRWDDLPPATQACIDAQYPFNWSTTEEYDYWRTDTYVAKLRLSTGQPIWTATFDSDPETDHGCWPDDIRKQECMYKITEADDGGLVVSGNTSHNFDDGYLAKFRSDCQSKLAYENLPLDAMGTHVLPADQTWTTDKDIVGRLVIPAGRTLTVTAGATIRFADSEQMQWPTQLIVQPGGRLVMDAGGTLSAVNGTCPASMWDGVQVRGNYFANQSPSSNQGHVRLGSGATIEHARTGLLTAWGDPGDPLGAIIKESTGGIIQATDAVFRNNRYDVVFRPYENRTSQGTVIANRSSFTRCQFLTQGDLNDADRYPEDHVALAAVRGISFKGCTFSNAIVGSTYDLPFEQGTGIHAMNSSFLVSNDCSVLVPYPNPCPPGNTTISSFTNLHRGILATTFDPSRTFSVSDASFTGTNYGIRMEGIQDAAMHRNTFEVPEPITPGIVGSLYGVYSDQCTGYSIQENAFLTTQPGGLNKKVGLVIKDSGPYYNTFYNNTFENLYTGSIIEGKNATADETIGLEVKCNDYGLAEANNFDVALTGGFVRVQASQGTFIVNPGDQNEWSNPAGNRFSLLHDGTGDPEEDWYVEDLSTFVEYFHHTATFGNRTRPDYHDMDWLFPNDQSVPWPTDRNLTCPSRLESGGHEVKRLTAEQEHDEYGDSKDAYDATKDDGDTYSLLGYVSDPAHSSAQVRNALQSVAPKVSTEVWQAAFERSPAMSAWHITQALLSNSPLQGEVLKMVDYYGLPEPYANLVYYAQGGEVNILSLLQSAMAIHGGAKSEALSDLGRMTWLDSLNFDPYLDSLLLIHGELPAWNSALTESGVLAAKGHYSALEVLAQNEALSGESPELYDLLKRYAEAEQSAGWDDAATVDLAWLAQLAAQRDVQGSAHANAWLHALGTDLPEEIILLPGEGPKSMGQRSNANAIAWETGIALEVFPNPSSGPVFAVVEVPEEVEQAEIRLADMHGRILQVRRLSGGPGFITLKTEGLASGLYMAEVRLDGHHVAQAKVIIQR